MAEKELKYVVTADNKGAVTSVKKFGTTVSKTNKAIAASSQKVTNSIISSWKRIAGVVAGAFTVRALASFSKDIIDMGDRFDKLSQQLEVSVEWLSQLKQAAELGGTDIERLNTGIRQMAVQLDLAATGTGKAHDQLKKFGLSAKELIGLGTEGALQRIAQTALAIQNPLERAAFLASMFGTRVASDMIPVLEDAANGFKNFAALMTGEQAKAFAAFNDSLTKFKAAVIPIVAKALEPIVKNMSKWIDKNKEFIAQKISRTIEFLAKAIKLLYENLDSVVTLFTGFVALKLGAFFVGTSAGFKAVATATTQAAAAMGSYSAAVGVVQGTVTGMSIGVEVLTSLMILVTQGIQILSGHIQKLIIILETLGTQLVKNSWWFELLYKSQLKVSGLTERLNLANKKFDAELTRLNAKLAAYDAQLKSVSATQATATATMTGLTKATATAGATATVAMTRWQKFRAGLISFNGALLTVIGTIVALQQINKKWGWKKPKDDAERLERTIERLNERLKERNELIWEHTRIIVNQETKMRRFSLHLTESAEKELEILDERIKRERDNIRFLEEQIEIRKEPLFTLEGMFELWDKEMAKQAKERIDALDQATEEQKKHFEEIHELQRGHVIRSLELDGRHREAELKALAHKFDDLIAKYIDYTDVVHQLQEQHRKEQRAINEKYDAIELEEAKKQLDDMFEVYDEANKKKLEASLERSRKQEEEIARLDKLGLETIRKNYEEHMQWMKEQTEEFTSVFKNEFSTAFDALIEGSEKAKHVLQDMFAAIFKQLGKLLLFKGLFGDGKSGGLVGGKGGLFGGILGAIGGGLASLGGSYFGGSAVSTAVGTGQVINPNTPGIMSLGQIIMGAMGGIFPGGLKSLQKGGTVDQPTLGLVGEGGMNEAVVPLPNGRSIPVDMKGGAGVNINVSVNAEDRGDDAANKRFGKQIAMQIREQVRNVINDEKRYGGSINRHTGARAF